MLVIHRQYHICKQKLAVTVILSFLEERYSITRIPHHVSHIRKRNIRNKEMCHRTYGAEKGVIQFLRIQARLDGKEKLHSRSLSYLIE